MSVDDRLAFQSLPKPIDDALKSIAEFSSQWFRQSFDVAVESFADVADSKFVKFSLAMNDETMLRATQLPYSIASAKASLLAVAEFPSKL